MDKLLTRLRNLNTVGFITIMVGLKLINAVFFGILTKQLTGKDIEDSVFHFSSKWEEFFVACVAAPLVRNAVVPTASIQTIAKVQDEVYLDGGYRRPAVWLCAQLSPDVYDRYILWWHDTHVLLHTKDRETSIPDNLHCACVV